MRHTRHDGRVVPKLKTAPRANWLAEKQTVLARVTLIMKTSVLRRREANSAWKDTNSIGAMPVQLLKSSLAHRRPARGPGGTRRRSMVGAVHALMLVVFVSKEAPFVGDKVAVTECEE